MRVKNVKEVELQIFSNLAVLDENEWQESYGFPTERELEKHVKDSVEDIVYCLVKDFKHKRKVRGVLDVKLKDKNVIKIEIDNDEDHVYDLKNYIKSMNPFRFQFGELMFFNLKMNS